MTKKQKYLVGLFLLLVTGLSACGDNTTTSSSPGIQAAPAATATTTTATTAAPTITAPAPATTLSSVDPQAIRKTDWLKIMKADPKLENRPVPFGGKIETYLSIKGTQLGGMPELEGIVYLDMDGDKVKEAAIPLISGGTAGNIGFVVYKYATPAPRLVGWGEGYKLGLKQQQGKLVAQNAIYAGWEPNCCPSGFSLN